MASFSKVRITNYLFAITKYLFNVRKMKKREMDKTVSLILF